MIVYTIFPDAILHLDKKEFPAQLLYTVGAKTMALNFHNVEGG